MGSSAVGAPGKEQMYNGSNNRQSGTISALSGDTGTSPGGFGAAAGGLGSPVGSTPPLTQASELEPRAARPWSLRSELEGSAAGYSLADYAEAPGDGPGASTGPPGAAGTGGYGAHGGAGGVEGGHRGNIRSEELSPVSELPG